MDAKDLYLYKVCSKHSPIELYVAAENQREAVLKVKDSEIFKDEDPSQLSIKYVDLVRV